MRGNCCCQQTCLRLNSGVRLVQSIGYLGAMAVVAWLASGCASTDVNPKVPRSGRGYVDLYVVPRTNVWWKVDVFHSGEQRYKEFTAQFEAPAQDIFRVEARPGRYRARVRFVNQAVLAPAEIEVEVRAGMITPVRVLAEKAGSAYVRKVQDRFNPYKKNEVADFPQRLWEITATVQPPVPYARKEQATYWQ